jgi:hypothetical protein
MHITVGNRQLGDEKDVRQRSYGLVTPELFKIRRSST